MNIPFPYLKVVLSLSIATLISCNEGHKSQQVQASTDTTLPAAAAKATEPGPLAAIRRIDSLIAAIDQQEYSKSKAFLEPIEEQDTVWTTLYYSNKLARKLEYTLLGDAGTDEGVGHLYFLPDSTVISKAEIGLDLLFEVLSANGDYYVFFKRAADGSYKPVNKDADLDTQFATKLRRRIFDLMQPYPDYNLGVSDQLIGKGLILTALGKLSVYEQKDTASRELSQLNRGDKVEYLQSSRKTGSWNGKRWVWYQIKWKEKVGWVIGYPGFLLEETDEFQVD